MEYKMKKITVLILIFISINSFASITGAIPLPGDPGEAFGNAFNRTDEMFSNNRRLRMEQQQINEAAQYHRQQFALGYARKLL